MKTKPQNIWFLQDGEPLPLGSTQRLMRTYSQAEYLWAKGYSVTWFASRFDHVSKKFTAGPREQKLNDGFEIVLLDGPGYRRNISPARFWHLFRVGKSFSRQVDLRPKPDVVVASWPSPELAYAGAVVCKRLSVPLVVDVRDPWPEPFLSYLPSWCRWVILPVVRYYRNLLRKTLEVASLVTAVNEPQLLWALNNRLNRGTPLEGGHVIALGYPNSEHFIFQPTPVSFSEKCPLVISFVGDFNNTHGVERIALAIRHLRERTDLPVHFALVGDGEKLPSVRSLLAGVGGCHIPGRVGSPELARYLTSSHFGLVSVAPPMRRYYLGNKVFEYMAFGCGIITPESGSTTNFVNQYGIGVALQNDTAEAFVQAIKALIAEPERVATMRHRAREIFEKNFTTEVLNARFEELLKNVHAPASNFQIRRAFDEAGE